MRDSLRIKVICNFLTGGGVGGGGEGGEYKEKKLTTLERENWREQ